MFDTRVVFTATRGILFFGVVFKLFRQGVFAPELCPNDVT